jgi:hypothetical protein
VLSSLTLGWVKVWELSCPALASAYKTP